MILSHWHKASVLTIFPLVEFDLSWKRTLRWHWCLTMRQSLTTSCHRQSVNVSPITHHSDADTYNYARCPPCTRFARRNRHQRILQAHYVSQRLLAPSLSACRDKRDDPNFATSDHISTDVVLQISDVR